MELDETLSELSSRVWLNLHIRPNKSVLDLVYYLIDNKTLKVRSDRVRSVGSILANLVSVVNLNSKRLYINRRNDFYKSVSIFNTKGVSSRFSRKLCKSTMVALESKGYITQKLGYHVAKYDRKEYGYIVLTDKFLDAVNATKAKVNRQSVQELVIITNNLNEKIKAKEEDKMRLDEMMSRTAEYNEFISQYDIEYNHGIELTTWLCRIFKDNLTKHGRIYNLYAENNYQSLSKSLRHTITIDGECTVELDYQHLHPSLCYSLSGESFSGDAYDILGRTSVTPRDLLDGTQSVTSDAMRYVIRSLVKSCFVRVLNTGSKVDCIKSVIKMLDEDKTKDFIQQNYPGISPKHKEVANTVLSALEEIHWVIAEDYFYKSKGLTLMNFDSTILGYLLVNCKDNKIPALPLHDSIIVPQSYEADAQRLMEWCYYFVVGESNEIFITSK